MVFLKFVFGLRKSLNDCSAGQETVRVTVRMTTVIPKLHRALSPKKLDETISRWDIFYTEITQAVSFHIYYRRCRDYLKTSANFGNILGESSSRISGNRAFHLFSE